MAQKAKWEAPPEIELFPYGQRRKTRYIVNIRFKAALPRIRSAYGTIFGFLIGNSEILNGFISPIKKIQFDL